MSDTTDFDEEAVPEESRNSGERQFQKAIRDLPKPEKEGVMLATGRREQDEAIERLMEAVAGKDNWTKAAALELAEEKTYKTKAELEAVLDRKKSEYYHGLVDVETIVKTERVGDKEPLYQLLLDVGGERGTVALRTSALMDRGTFAREAWDIAERDLEFPYWEDTLDRWFDSTEVVTVEQELRPEAERGFVYLMEHEHGFVKIGRSKTPESRCSSINTGSPYDIELVATFESDDAALVEKWLHEQYAAYRKTGEWFDIPEGELQSLKGLYETKARDTGRGLLERGRFR